MRDRAGMSDPSVEMAMPGNPWKPLNAVQEPHQSMRNCPRRAHESMLLTLHAGLPCASQTSPLYACSVLKACRPSHCSQTVFWDAEGQEG